MRVAFVSPGEPTVSRYETEDILGIETQIWGNAKVLAARGHDVTILRKGPRDATSERIRDVVVEDVRTPDLGSRNIDAVVFSRRCAEQIARTGAGVALLAERITASAVIGTSIPSIFTLHLSDGLLKDGPEDSLRNALTHIPKRLLEWHVLRASNAVVTLTPDAKRKISRLGTDSVVIPNAIDPADLKPSRSSGFFLYAGRLVVSKGVEYLLRATEILAREHPDIRVRIVGSGPDERRLKSLSEELHLSGVVGFEPFMNRRAYLEILGTSIAYILPSLQETFSVGVIEAMGSGKPVVVSDVSGPNEIVDNGRDGFVVRPRDVTALVRAMRDILENPQGAVDMGERGRSSVLSKYTFTKTALRYENLSKELVGL